MPHIHDKIDFTVEVFIVYRNKVLLRVHDKFGIWLSVGGHIELDEDPNQAASREVKEEVGLDITINDKRQHYLGQQADYTELIPPVALNRHKVSSTHEHVTLVFFATSPSDKVDPSGHDVSDQWHWFSKDELDEPQYNLAPNIAYYAKLALDELGS